MINMNEAVRQDRHMKPEADPTGVQYIFFGVYILFGSPGA